MPAGSGRTSGQWTRGLSVLEDITAEAAQQLGRFALRLLSAGLSEGAAAAAAFGLLFIPSPDNLSVEGKVDGLPGVRYAWNCDESTLHLTSDSPDGGQNTFSAQLEDDVFRDKNGRIIARILPNGSIAVDPAAVFPDIANDNEPRLCPLPGLDKPGERGRDYEDYVKSVVNPVDTTPRYWGFQLLNPETGKLVYYDDCQHMTGMMVDAKGPEYANLLAFDAGRESVEQEFLDRICSATLGARRRASFVGTLPSPQRRSSRASYSALRMRVGRGSKSLTYPGRELMNEINFDYSIRSDLPAGPGDVRHRSAPSLSQRWTP